MPALAKRATLGASMYGLLLASCVAPALGGRTHVMNKRSLVQDAQSDEGHQAAAADSPTVEELLAVGLKNIKEILQAEDLPDNCGTEGSDLYTEPIEVEVQAKGKAQMSALRVSCFLKARKRSNFYDGEESFFKSVESAKPIHAGGISGAQHFLSKDRKFYLKTIPNTKEVAVLEGAFLASYVDHLTMYPNSLLTRMNALIKFDLGGTFSSTIHHVLVMDNGKFDVTSDDSTVSFDLKGSKWKHRLKKDGGMRCLPLFPLEFWKGGKFKDNHKSEGEDIDFVAMRTQLSRSWYQKMGHEIAAAQNPALRKFLARRLHKFPWHDDCAANQQWIYGESSKNPDWDFCQTLRDNYEAFSDATNHALSRGELFNVTDFATPVTQKSCKSALGGWSGPSKDWWAFVRDEKASLENMRDFYGYATPTGHDGSVKPLVVEPCMKKALTAQISKDVELLREHDLVDYSLDLVVKYEKDPMSCRKPPPGKNIFTAYKGGVRAVAEYDFKPEKAVYVMQILDFLGKWDGAKNASVALQSLTADNKVESSMPRVLNELMGMTSSKKCKYMPDGLDPSVTPYFCWSSCSAEPACDMYGAKLANSGKDIFYELAEFDFNTPVSGDSADDLICSAKKMSRSLCVAAPKNPGQTFRGVEKVLTVFETMPEPFRSKMPDHEVEAQLTDAVQHVLVEYLKLRIERKAPITIKRVALMAYYEFARKPFREDTIPLDEYAERFKQYINAWITAPSNDHFQSICQGTQSERCPGA